MGDRIRFIADDVELDPQVGFIGFANEEQGRHFWMQPGESSSGRSLNKEEIWLERDDQQWGGSGGDWKIRLTRTSFNVDTSQLPWMGSAAIEIGLSLDDSQYRSPKELLQRVMTGCLSDLTIDD
jgi:hypothetical protein